MPAVPAVSSQYLEVRLLLSLGASSSGEGDQEPSRQPNSEDNSGKEEQPVDILFQSQNSDDPFRADFRDSSEPKLMTTFSGGTSLIFEMIAKKMLDWGNEARPFNEPADSSSRGVAAGGTRTTLPSSSPASLLDGSAESLPRWHPHAGIEKLNPNFRREPPAMNNQGFARSIWRNARKRNKPSLWRYALRTYDRMTMLEQDPQNIYIQRSIIHFEGGMQACGKLGLWQRALEIYHSVSQLEHEAREKVDRVPTSKPATGASPEAIAADRRSWIRQRIHVTDTMITALVQACVVASRERRRESASHLSPQEEEREAALRRIPLDTALEILMTARELHNIPVVARHVNPLAAAYQSLGYVSVATEILQNLLTNRTAGEEPEVGADVLNVFDLCAKDKGSYSLIVQGAVVTGDWGAAVDALGDMTQSGLYPAARHCHLWSEISERRTRPRATGSSKKKRESLWVESVG